MASTFRPNVCLIDLNMPGMDGDEVARRLAQSAVWHPLLLVTVTAMDDEKSCQRIKAAGFHLRMVKPANVYKLLPVVDALFRLRDPQSAVLAAGKAEQADLLSHLRLENTPSPEI